MPPSLSLRFAFPQAAGIGLLISLVNWNGCSSIATTGHAGLYGSSWVASTFSMAATNSPFAFGGTIQLRILLRGMRFF